MGKVLKVTKKSNDSILQDTVAKAQKRIDKKEKGKARKQKAAEKVKPSVNQVARKQKRIKARIEAKRQNRDKYHKELGVLLVSHIPHGFFEEQMERFFSQFGKVHRVRVVRSTISGRSKGYGFVVFKYKEVAQIAAETTNNYLMGKRILKVKLIPSEEVKGKWFYYSTPSNIRLTVASKRRGKSIKAINKNLTPKEGLKRLETQKETLKQMVKNLTENGIDFKCNALDSV